jgi:hypothetical protein
MNAHPWRCAVLALAALATAAASNLCPADEAPAAPKPASRDWKPVLREWRGAIVMGERDEGDASRQAKENIRSIRDPLAVPAINDALKSEKNHNVRLLYYQALANIPTADSLEALVHASVKETGESMRHAVAELIATMPNREDAIPLYVKFLRSSQYAGFAAEAVSLGGIAGQYSPGGQLDRSLTYGLINALVGEEIRGRVVYPWAAGQWLTGRGVYSSFRSTREIVKVAVPVRNPQAREALSQYTDQDFGYDQESWRRWCDRELRARSERK